MSFGSSQSNSSGFENNQANNSSRLKEQLRLTQSISKDDFHQSSMINCLKEKMQELLQLKEANIALESQLKMAKESNKIQEAAFAFQRAEYEEEIKSLKLNERQLQRAITLNNKSPKLKYDVNVKLDTEEKEEAIEKYNKWKNKAKDLVDENQRLNDIINKYQKNEENFIREKKQDKKIIKELKEEIEANNRHKNEQLQELHAQIQQLKNDREDLKTELRQNKIENQNNEMKLKSMKDEQKITNDSSNNIEHQMTSVEIENQRLRIQNKTYAKQNHKLKDLADQIPKYQSILQHVEIEYHHLCDILDIDHGDILKPWEILTRECENYIQMKNNYHEIKNKNTTLQKRISAILSERKKSRANKEISNSNDSEDYIEAMIFELNCLKNDKENLESSLEHYKYSTKFSSHIINIYSKLVRQIDDLHESICGYTPTKLRPVILTIIFTRRFYMFSTYQTANDESSLFVFGGRLQYAADSKLASIKEKFSTLTSDLLDAKTQLAYFSSRSRHIEQEKNHTDNQLQTSTDQLLLVTKKLGYLRERMRELQEELATLVPEEVHNELCNAFAKSKKKNDNYRKTIIYLQQLLDKQASKAKQIHKEMDQIEFASNQNLNDIEEYSAQLKVKEYENETLQSMLNEKTKEILALERMILRLKEKLRSDNIAENAKSTKGIVLKEEENQDENIKHEKKAITALNFTNTSLQSLINPDFLK